MVTIFENEAPKIKLRPDCVILVSMIIIINVQVTSVDDVPPPIVQIGPANQTLPLQSVATLPCQAIGTPQPRIKWYKNGSPLISQGPRIKVLDSGTLHIDGEYMGAPIGW
jgi:hypothetical protein